MAPLSMKHHARHSDIFELPSTTRVMQQTTNAVTDTLRLVIVILGLITLFLITTWVLSRVKLRWSRRLTLKSATGTGIYEDTYVLSPSGFEVFESDISIDMIAEDGQTYSSGTEFDDLSDCGDLETILSSASATRLEFRLDSLPNIMKGSILERRGRKDMLCDTSAYYEFDTVATNTTPLSAVHEAITSVARPIFGFNFQDITPPVGSPLWSRKIDIQRPMVPGPLTHPPQLA